MLNRNKRFASKLAGSRSSTPCSTSPDSCPAKPGVNHASFSTPKSVRIEHTLSAVKCILAIFERTKITHSTTHIHTWMVKMWQKSLVCSEISSLQLWHTLAFQSQRVYQFLKLLSRTCCPGTYALYR